LDTAIERRLFDALPEYLIKPIETALQTMQVKKYSFTRGPSGFFERIKGMAAAIEAEAKQTRREAFFARKNSISSADASKINMDQISSSLGSPTRSMMMMASGSETKVDFSRKNSSSAKDVNDSSDEEELEKGKEDAPIFNLEIDDESRKSPIVHRKGKAAWTKLDFRERNNKSGSCVSKKPDSNLPPNSTDLPPKSWTAPDPS
jgi:hypothetical protein